VSRLLLDTHVFLRWRAGGGGLAPAARAAIQDADVVYVSAASAWEAAIKIALGRLHLPGRFEDGVLASRFEPLAVTMRHAEETANLPPLHRDPFDRMLVAQARVEGLTLVTRDPLVLAYGVVGLVA